MHSNVNFMFVLSYKVDFSKYTSLYRLEMYPRKNDLFIYFKISLATRASNFADDWYVISCKDKVIDIKE